MADWRKNTRARELKQPRLSPITIPCTTPPRLAPRPRSAAWLNHVGRWFAALTEKQLRRGVFRSTRELEEAIARYLQATNAQPQPFIWTKTAEQILASLAHFCQRLSDSAP